MNRKIIIAVVLFLATASPAYAFNLADIRAAIQGDARVKSENAEMRAETKAEMKANIAERQADREAKSETRAEGRLEAQAKMEKLRDERGGFLGHIAGQRVKNVHRLFEATIARFEKLIDRIESRLEKIEEAGGNTTEAEASITLAKNNLTEAKADLVLLMGIDFSKGTTTATSTAEANFEKAKSLAVEIRDSLRMVKENLMNVVSSLKAVSATLRIEARATSTATTTNSN